MNTLSSFARDARASVSSQDVTRHSAAKKERRTACSGLFFIGALLVLCLITSGSALAQGDPFLGTWKLNVAKSKFGAGPARKSETRIVVSTPTGMKIDVDRTNADGTNQQFEYTANLDGKSYPITGNGPYGADAISVNLSAPNTIASTLTKAGKVVATGTSVVSKDGKTLTISAKGTDEKGKTYSSISVYDKQ
jgi:hypothetical protein